MDGKVKKTERLELHCPLVLKVKRDRMRTCKLCNLETFLLIEVGREGEPWVELCFNCAALVGNCLAWLVKGATRK